MIAFLTKIYWETKLPIYEIPQSKLYAEGIKCILIDVDGTLIGKNSENLTNNVKKWINKSKDIFDLYLISNNPSGKRISRIGNELGLKYKYRALKPRRKATLEAIKQFKTERKNIAIIGDRIFTDIIVGNRCKIKTVLVKCLNKKGKPVKYNLTLFFEKFFSLFLI